MFDFENMTVYQKAKVYNRQVESFLATAKLSKVKVDQLSRASFSIMLNIAEGSGRFTKPDKRNFYNISRGSVFECVAVFDYLKDTGKITEELFKQFYALLEELSKMLYSLIKNLTK